MLDKVREEKLFKKLQKLPRSNALETRKTAIENKLTLEEAKTWFRYNDGKVYWIKSPHRRIQAGSEAGCIKYKHNIPIKIITLRGKNYSTARIVFLLHHGYFPKCIIYMDGNKLNDDFHNIRASNAAIRNYRSSVVRSNSGYKGIYFEERRNKYSVQLRLNGHCKFIGYYDDIESAKEAYNRASKRIYCEFANEHKLEIQS